MFTLVNLFGRSPFSPLLSHMERVIDCVHCLPKLFDAMEKRDEASLEALAEEISRLEHQADLIKNDIRNHLPKSLFLPIDRGNLLKILTLQDQIADRAQDIAVIVTVKPLELLPIFKDEFKLFLQKNIETFDKASLIIKEMHELVESSFGGIEAEKVGVMIDEVAYQEHEVDLIQRQLLKSFFKAEDQLTYVTFHQWQRVFENVDLFLISRRI